MLPRGPFLLLAPRIASEAKGFIATDLSDGIIAPKASDYIGYWLNSDSQEIANALEPPSISVDVGPATGMFRSAEVVGNNLISADPRILRLLDRLIQRIVDIYISNSIAPDRFPVFLSSSRTNSPTLARVHLELSVSKYWDFPDVRLEVMKQRTLVANLRQRMVEKFGVDPEKLHGSPDLTVEYERVARVRDIRVGLYLPCCVGTVGPESRAVVRLDSGIVDGTVDATIFTCGQKLDVSQGDELIRLSSSDHLGSLVMEKSLIGKII